MDKIPEERAGTMVRAMLWIKIPEERAGTVVRGPWIKYQKRWLTLW
jgi:hypothetical protein